MDLPKFAIKRKFRSNPPPLREVRGNISSPRQRGGGNINVIQTVFSPNDLKNAGGGQTTLQFAILPVNILKIRLEVCDRMGFRFQGGWKFDLSHPDLTLMFGWMNHESVGAHGLREQIQPESSPWIQ